MERTKHAIPPAIQNYKADPKLITGGDYDNQTERFHWTKGIEANNIFCESLYYQIRKHNPFLNSKLPESFRCDFPKRFTTRRLGTCWPTQKRIALYCRSLFVWIHEISHFAARGHGDIFHETVQDILQECENFIPIKHHEKLDIVTSIVRHQVRRWNNLNNDDRIMEYIETAAKINNLKPEDLLDNYYKTN